MQLNYGKKYSKLLKEYSDEIKFYLCEGKKPGEISKSLHDEFKVDVPTQAITWFYHNNKEYFDECIKNRNKERKEELQEELGLDWLKKQAYNVFRDLGICSSELKKLPLEKRLKYGISLMNAIGKLEGKDQSTIANNNYSFKELTDIFKDDLEWD